MRAITLPALVLLTSVSSASASVYTTTLSSLNQVPQQESSASGSATVKLVGDLLSVDVIFNGLAGKSPFGHIHCCAPAGANAEVAVPFIDFPQAATGEYKHSFNLLDGVVYEAAFLGANGGTAVGASAALVTGLDAGLAYVNIHDAPAYPDGEIRGQLAPSAVVPEPAVLGLLGIGALTMGVARRRA